MKNRIFYYRNLNHEILLMSYLINYISFFWFQIVYDKVFPKLKIVKTKDVSNTFRISLYTCELFILFVYGSNFKSEM